MKNKDLIQRDREGILQRMTAAVQNSDSDAFSQAWSDLAANIQSEVLEEARALHDQTDAAILSARGVRQLTSAETQYYEDVIQAMRAPDPKQALNNISDVLPKTTIDAIFDDLTASHPLLDAVNFVNTESLIEYLVNTNGYQLASWSPLCAKITKELNGGFKKVTLTLNKLSAYLPLCKAMLDLGPAWLDRYVRAVLAEALYLGLEEGIINGTGKDMPIGMTRQVGDDVTVTGGVYPEKELVPVTDLDPVAYGELLSTLAKAPNGKTRVVERVLMVVNPVDYLRRIMPATTIRAMDGTYVSNVLPFPTTIVQSVQVAEGKMIVGLPRRYFMGVGTAKSGRIEYSDEYRFLDDERVYLIKLYGHGEPMDNNAFAYCDISGLQPASLSVKVTKTDAAQDAGDPDTGSETP